MTVSFAEGGIYYLKDTAILVQKCTWKLPGSADMLFYDFILTYSVGIWVPSLILLILHIIIYRKLQKQANIRMHTSTMNSSQQMKKVVKTFYMIVIAFCVCMLPNSFLITYYAYTRTSGKSVDPKVMYIMHLIFPCLWNLQSCLNPLIYGKIHHKIFLALRSALQYAAWCSCKFKTHNSSRGSQSVPTEICEIAIKRESDENQLSSMVTPWKVE